MIALALFSSTIVMSQGNVNNGNHQHLSLERSSSPPPFGRCFNSENRFSSQTVLLSFKPMLFFCAPRRRTYALAPQLYPSPQQGCTRGRSIPNTMSLPLLPFFCVFLNPFLCRRCSLRHQFFLRMNCTQVQVRCVLGRRWAYFHK